MRVMRMRMFVATSMLKSLTTSHASRHAAACELDAMLNLSSETGPGSQQRVAVEAQQQSIFEQLSCCSVGFCV